MKKIALCFSAVILLISGGCKFHPELAGPGTPPDLSEWAESSWTVILYFGMDNIQFGTFPTDLWGLSDNLLAGGASLSRPDFPIIMLYDGTEIGDTYIINLENRTIIDDRGEVIDPQSHEVNYGDPDTMSRFIIWAARRYPARHYLLGLCHHYGWKGYNTDESSPGPIGMDILTIPEHAAAMEKVSEAGIHIDVIWFEACSITMLETLYQYARDADFVVGGEDTIDFFELVIRPFRILARIRKDPGLSPLKLAQTLVEKTPVVTPSLFTNQLTPYTFALNPGSPGDRAKIGRLFDIWLPTQFAFSGKGINEVAEAVDSLAGLLIRHLTEERQNIEFCRKRAKEYSLSPWYIDLWDFACLLEERTSNIELKKACAELKDRISSAVVAEKKLFFDQHHHGILIQFPLTREEYECQVRNEFDTINSYADLEFAKDTLWDEFMEELWRTGT
jgi:hypothetical protein